MLTLWIALFAGLTAAAGAYRLAPQPGAAQRFARYAPQADTATAQASWTTFLVQAFALPAERLLPSHSLEHFRLKVREAGLQGLMPLQLLLATMLACALAGGLSGACLGKALALPMALLGALSGAALPYAVLLRKAHLRRAQLHAALPDSLDLLTASVEAGLGLDSAIALQVRRTSPHCRALNAEFTRYLQEVNMGAPRHEALKALASRSGLEELRQVVTALLQGEVLGVGSAHLLRVQAQQLRLRRKQAAEEKAMKAPVKILFPLLFGIFPSIFVILLGPAALRVMDTFLA